MQFLSADRHHAVHGPPVWSDDEMTYMMQGREKWTKASARKDNRNENKQNINVESSTKKKKERC